MLFNAVVISVLVIVVLSLLRVNILFELIIAALTGGLILRIGLTETARVMVREQPETALSYILRGIFVVLIELSGIISILVNKMVELFLAKKLLLFSLAVLPIPPLLVLFDKLKLDRCAISKCTHLWFKISL